MSRFRAVLVLILCLGVIAVGVVLGLTLSRKDKNDSDLNTNTDLDVNEVLGNVVADSSLNKSTNLFSEEVQRALSILPASIDQTQVQFIEDPVSGLVFYRTKVNDKEVGYSDSTLVNQWVTCESYLTSTSVSTLETRRPNYVLEKLSLPTSLRTLQVNSDLPERFYEEPVFVYTEGRHAWPHSEVRKKSVASYYENVNGSAINVGTELSLAQLRSWSDTDILVVNTQTELVNLGPLTPEHLKTLLRIWFHIEPEFSFNVLTTTQRKRTLLVYPNGPSTSNIYLSFSSAASLPNVRFPWGRVLFDNLEHLDIPAVLEIHWAPGTQNDSFLGSIDIYVSTGGKTAEFTRTLSRNTLVLQTALWPAPMDSTQSEATTVDQTLSLLEATLDAVSPSPKDNPHQPLFVFLGDSIISSFRREKSWISLTKGLRTVNLGITGAQPHHTSYYLEKLKHRLHRLGPLIFVVMSGTHLISSGNSTFQDVNFIVESVCLLLHTVSYLFPTSTVLLNTILPYGNDTTEPEGAAFATSASFFQERVFHVNKALHETVLFENNRRPLNIGTWEVVDTYRIFLDTKTLCSTTNLVGCLPDNDRFVDNFHPSEIGYEAWAALLRPRLLHHANQTMKDRSDAESPLLKPFYARLQTINVPASLLTIIPGTIDELLTEYTYTAPLPDLSLSGPIQQLQFRLRSQALTLAVTDDSILRLFQMEDIPPNARVRWQMAYISQETKGFDRIAYFYLHAVGPAEPSRETIVFYNPTFGFTLGSSGDQSEPAKFKVILGRYGVFTYEQPMKVVYASTAKSHFLTVGTEVFISTDPEVLVKSYSLATTDSYDELSFFSIEVLRYGHGLEVSDTQNMEFEQAQDVEDVLWFAGQSNMTGASNNIDTNYKEFLLSKKVYEWNVITRSRQRPQKPVIHSFAESWVESICKDQTSNVSCENSRNMTASVASSYSNELQGKTVTVVNTSFKGSGFATVGCESSPYPFPSWGPVDDCTLNPFVTNSLLNNGRTLRENAINSVIDCLKARTSARLKALIWFQGESGNTQEDLRTLFTYWRTTLHSNFPNQGYSSLPIVIVQTGTPVFSSYDEQLKYAASDNNAHLVDLQDLYSTSVFIKQEYAMPFDPIHFSATTLTTIITERVVSALRLIS